MMNWKLQSAKARQEPFKAGIVDISQIHLLYNSLLMITSPPRHAIWLDIQTHFSHITHNDIIHRFTNNSYSNTNTLQYSIRALESIVPTGCGLLPLNSEKQKIILLVQGTIKQCQIYLSEEKIERLYYIISD